MRGIASRLGVSATALYQHFESKDSILREIRLTGVKRLAEAMRPCSSIEDPIEQARAFAEAYIIFSRQNPWLYSVLMEHEELDWASLTDEETGAMTAPLRLVKASIEKGQEAGVFRQDVTATAASFHMWSAMHGLCSLLINGRLAEGHPAFPVGSQSDFVAQFVGGLTDIFRAEIPEVAGTAKPDASASA